MIRIVLDSGPLGMIAHPKPNPEIADWLLRLLYVGAIVVIPEIADYEVRRDLLLAGLTESVDRLNELESELEHLPLTTEAMQRAAEFWAEARRVHQPTAPNEALDGDMILAAQTALAEGVIATENVGHLSRFVEARDWREIEPDH